MSRVIGRRQETLLPNIPRFFAARVQQERSALGGRKKEMRPGARTAKAKSFYLSLDTLIDGLGRTRYNEPRKAPEPYLILVGQE